MSKDFLKIGEREFRVEANWNAIADFCRRKGVNDLGQIDFLAKIAIDDILPLMHCCIKEGERMENRSFELSEIDLGELVNTAEMGQFMQIYAGQSSPKLKAGNAKKK
jgi:hypothetical protein|nr:MAG TPA: tail assembly chaperone protein [Caudoviricetes sp.]